GPSLRIMPSSLGRSFADHSLGPEAGDGLAPVPEDAAQNSLGVLPQGRGRRGPADLACGADGTRHLADAAEVRVLHLDDHLSRADLLVLEGLRHGVDGRAGDVAAE